MDSTGVMTAGAAALFWPAAPAFLLTKGKDVNLNKGMVFDTFTDQDHSLTNLAATAEQAIVLRRRATHLERRCSQSGRIGPAAISK
jgi:hypothetical protein